MLILNPKSEGKFYPSSMRSKNLLKGESRYLFSVLSARQVPQVKSHHHCSPLSGARDVPAALCMGTTLPLTQKTSKYLST